MSSLPVTLSYWSNEQHLSHVYTGLAMLHRQGKIRLTQRLIDAPAVDPLARPHLQRAHNWHCKVEAEGTRYYIDTHDGDEINLAGLDWCNRYLKRGYNPNVVLSHKVMPLGLNYEVFADGVDCFELKRRVQLQGVTSAAKYLVRHPRSVRELQAPPTGINKIFPWVLFLCRAWETNHKDAEKNKERHLINESRAAIIRALRKEFGPLCGTAGFSPTPFALAKYPDAVMPIDLSRPDLYLRTMRNAPICIATMGLHESNGWKLAEYVSHSRAIVSETLRHTVPGFHDSRHYLGFTDADECIEAVHQLMNSAQKRYDMMCENQAYYEHRVRPDRACATWLGV